MLGLLLAGGHAAAAILAVPAQYPTIQAAVDAAAPGGGDEIVVAAGLYEEQVVISHDVTVTGAGVGLTVLRAPVYMEHIARPPDYNPVVHAFSLQGEVVLRDLTIDGAGRGRAGTRFTGLLYERCGGVIERVAIENLHEPTLTNFNSGIGIYVYSGSEDDLQLRVQDVAITCYQKTGFACFGSGCLLDLREVVVDPTGYHGRTVQNGFELLNTSRGTLTNCTARLCWYGGSEFPSATACGFVIYYGNDWTVLDSRSDRCQTGFYNLGTALTLKRSEILGHPEELPNSYGIVTTGMFTGLAGGPDFGRPATLADAELAPAKAPGFSTTLDGCLLRGAGVPGSLGLLGRADLGKNAFLLENCDLSQWDVGILTSDASGLVAGRVRTCRIQDNLTLAALAQGLQPLDARGNYWGDPTGPYHPFTNPQGQGGLVSDNVVFEPWLKGNLVCAPVPQYIALADFDGVGYSREFTVRYLGGGGEPVYGFSADITWDQGLLTAGPADFSRPDEGLFQSAVLFQAAPIAGGVRVEAALGGELAGVAMGELFKVRFHLVGHPQYVEIPVDLGVRHLRDSENREIDGWVADDGLVIGDLEPPKFTLLKLTNTSLPHTNEFAKNGDLVRIDATVTDDDPLFGLTSLMGDLVFLFGTPGYQRVPDSYVDGTASWGVAPVELYPPDGLVPYRVFATDPAGNTLSVSGSITSDSTAPLSVGGLGAVSGHNRVDLQWDPPAGLDANLHQVVVRSVRTGLYPTYEAPAPAYPATPTDGEAVYAGLGAAAAALFPADGSGRDLVSFQAFAVDQVGHVSPAGAGSRDRAANYLPADITAGAQAGHDGVTDIYDLSRLGDTFGREGAQPGFNAECDVGPTDDGTSEGLPLPDGVIGLDDLMVFADRFDLFALPVAGAADGAAAGPVPLTWTRREPDLWVLELAAPCPQLKAFRLRATAAVGLAVQVRAGGLLQGQAAPHFLHAAPDGLDVSVALLGRGTGFAGTGELLRVTGARPLGRLAVGLEARGVDNRSLECSLTEEIQPAALPAVFALRGNYPNPFNPATTIAFDLPSPQPVRLVVYGLDGRLVRRLVQGRLAAGRHEVVWRGRDDQERAVAAGIYLYRLEAGPWAASGKLDLVK